MLLAQSELPHRRTQVQSVELLKDSFVSTKLYPPTWDEQGVQRTPLIRLAYSGRMTSVFSVVAAAGSGKSTLMSQLHQHFTQRDVATAWISLDPEDNNPETFLSYLVTALDRIEAMFSQADLGMQKELISRDVTAAFDVLLGRISKVKTQLVIFFDDFQHITDPAVTGFMDRLIAHLPDSVLLVIASRERLPLQLGRLRVLGSLCEVDQEDLNFDSGEAAAFLRQSHEMELSPADMESLHETTEGWAAGLQLAALALRRHKGAESEQIKQFSGRDRDLASYLAESVLKSLSESVRKFLLCTAPLRRMCPELCQAVTGHPACGEMLALLDRRKLFLIPLDRTGKWFRYHHLFADFLQKLLTESDPARRRESCEKAATWCEKEGLITEAIQYSLDAGRFEHAANLIGDRALMVAMIEGDHHTLLEWMRRLPEAYHGRRPEIGLSRAWSSAFSRDSAYANELAESVLVKLRDPNDTSWNLADDVRQSLICFGEVAQAIAVSAQDQFEFGSEQARSLCAKFPVAESALIGSALNCISYGHLAMREFGAALTSADEAYRHGLRDKASYVMVWADFLHAMASLELGNVQSASEHGIRAESHSKSGGEKKGFMLFMAALLNAEIATQRCEFKKAEELMAVGRTFAVLFGPVQPLICAFRNDARIAAWRGDYVGAMEYLERGRDIAMSSGYPRLYVSMLVEEASLQIAGDRPADAAETMRRLNAYGQSLVPADDPSPGVTRSRRNLIKFLEARVLLANGDPEKALSLLSRLQYALGADSETTLLQSLRAAKAIALWKLDRSPESIRELDKAVSAAADEFCAYPIVSMGRELLPIFAEIEDRRGKDADDISPSRRQFERWLVSVLRNESTASIEAIAVAAPELKETEILTAREVEILKLAESGLTNKRLAKALLITEATVKWHMHNVYGKLGVGSRTAAAARARKLQLI